jgi:hypothetical protein
MRPVVLLLLMMAFANVALADEHVLRVRLPDCPSELRLVVPQSFAGSVRNEAIVEHLNSNPARKGRYVLSLESSAGDLLQAMELGTTSKNQGRFEVSSLDGLEAEMRRALERIPPEAKEYQDALLKGAAIDGVTGPNLSLFDIWRKENALVLAAIVTFKLDGQPETKMLASQIYEVSEGCLAAVTYYVPLASKRTYSDIQQTVREIGFE